MSESEERDEFAEFMAQSGQPPPAAQGEVDEFALFMGQSAQPHPEVGSDYSQIPSKLMGLDLPSQDKFKQIYDASVAREEQMGQNLDAVGRNVVARRTQHRQDPFRRSNDRVDISLDGKDPAPATNYAELGANEIGVDQGLSFGLSDELAGLLGGKDAGKQARDFADYTQRAEPDAYTGGEMLGTGFNTLATLPVTAPKLLQIGRIVPGGAKTKAAVTGATSAAAWDTSFQMARGDGSVGDRFEGTDKSQTAIAAGIGGGAGWLVTAFVNPLSKQASEFSNVLEGVTDGRGTASPDGLRALERFLRDKGVPLDDVTLGRINSVVQDHSQAGSKTLTLPIRIKDVLVEALDGGSGQIRDAIKQQLRGTMGAGKEGATTIQNAVDEDYGAAREAIYDQYGNRLGQRKRIDSEDKTVAELKRIGEEGYEPALAAGPQSYHGARDLDEVLKGPGMKDGPLMTPLKEYANADGFELEDYIQQNPLRAAHWMQSKARELVDGGNKQFGGLRTRLLKAIEAASPGYDKLRAKYGDEYGNLQALEFGDKFLTNAGKEFEIDKMARAFKSLSGAQKRVALLSVRDVLRTATGKGRKGAPPRLTRVASEQTLDALETVFGTRGARVAQDIESVEGYVGRRTDIDVRKRGSQTTPLAEDVRSAQQNVQTPWRRKIGGALERVAGDAALVTGGFPPINAARKTLGSAGRAISGNQDRMMNAFAELLEAPIARRSQVVQTQRAIPKRGPDGRFLPKKLPLERPKQAGVGDPSPVIAKALRGLERKLTPPASAKHYAETLKASGLPQNADNKLPMLEQLEQPRRAASTLAEIAGRAEVRARQPSTRFTPHRRPNLSIRPDKRITSADGDAQVMTYARKREPEVAAERGARAARSDVQRELRAANKELRAAKAAFETAPGYPGSGNVKTPSKSGQFLEARNRYATAVERQRRARAAADVNRLNPAQLPTKGDASFQALRQELHRRGMPTDAMSRSGAKLKNIPLGPKRSVDEQMASLLLDPKKAVEAAQIAHSGEKFGTHELKAKALTAVGAAGLGYGAVKGNEALSEQRQIEADANRTKSRNELFAEIERTKTNYATSMSEDDLSDVQATINYTLALDADNRLTMDGKWGENTRAAVRKYQRSRGIRANGKLTGETLEAIRADQAELDRALEARGSLQTTSVR